MIERRIFLIFIIVSFVSVISAQNLPAIIDPFGYSYNAVVKAIDTSLAINFNNASIIGGQVDYFIYQYPLILDGATDGAAVTLDTNRPGAGRAYGRIAFSVDAGIYGLAMQIYDGIDDPSGNGNPCGGLTHLDNDAACANAIGIASPGLQLDLSQKDFFATEILSLDIANGANLIIRVWDNSGNSGYMNYIHPTPVNSVASAYKPLILFPFKSFTNSANIVWSNIRAFAVEFNSTVASVDLLIGPLQALGSTISKSSPTSQPVQPSQQVSFRVDVFPDIYQTNVVSLILTPITHNVTIVDTLPSEFIGFNASSISVADQNGTNIPVQTTINGNTATFTFSFINSQLPTLSYRGLLPPTFNFCSKSVCNNATVTLLSTTGTMSLTKSSTVSRCVNLTSTQSISTSYLTCPTTFSNTLQYNASVCNNGNGVATGVSFFHTSSNSLLNCTINFPSSTCNGATCSTNLGTLSAGECKSVSFSYDCSSLAQTCVPLTFSSAILANETCTNSSSTNSCSFLFSPASSNVVINSTCPQNLSPSNTTTQQLSTVCNSGTGLARNVIFNHTPSGALANCTLSIPGGSCIGSNCSRSLGDLAAGQCVNVAINIDCPTYARTCIPVNFPSTFFATDTCNGATPTSSCSFSLNPGTPSVSITNTCPQDLSPSNTTTQLSSNVCNTGTGIARNVNYTHTASGALANCTLTIPNGSCVGTTCTRSLGDLAVGECVNVLVNIDCPTYAKTCTSVNFPSTTSAVEGCGTPVTSQTCSFNLIPGTPSIRTTFNNCPSFSSNLTTSSVSRVCNSGTGIARNVNFTHTSSGALVNCTATLTNGTCNGATCTTSLGDFAVGQCVDVTVNYDCSAYSTECLVRNFFATVNVAEGCGSSNQQTSCTFSSNPSLQVKVSESLLNIVPARISENITWSINATNNGPATVKSFILQKVYPQYTFPTPQTLSSWSCGANNLCTYNGVSLSSGQTISNILFSVQLLNNTPIGTTQVCNNLTMISQPNQSNCFSQDITSSCAPVNPGVPDIQVEKGVFASQYTFTIDYENAGSGPINNLQLQEILQVGWKLNSALSTNGWKCGDTLCTFTIASVAPSASGKVIFVVDVEESSQTDSEGLKKCWENLVSSTFDDENYDPTPLNNQASAQIGSSCKECCDPAPCPTNVCNLQCPPPTVTVPCPVVTCSCKLPEYFCPPCQVNPPTCNCNQCSQTP